MGSNFPVNVAEAQLLTLQDLSAAGAPLGEAEDPKGSVELLGYSTGMSDPLARVAVGMNTVGAVARFVWLVSGSDRLEDIAYYESKARPYTDDGLSMPGSSYGKRIFNAAPGLNQMRGVVDELRSDRNSRRAAAVVWLPEDAVRQSNDIPCTFGLFFHIRDGGLIMTTVMRSNNAVVLLPYNFFEFSMVGELVAAELDVPFARYVHWAASMHTVNRFNGARDDILSAGSAEAFTMPVMPRGEAFESAYALARYETELRHASTADELKDTAARARAKLDEYWLALFNVLYVYGLAKRQFRELAKEEFDSIPDYFKDGTFRASEIRSLFDAEPLNIDTADGSLFVYDIEPLSAHAAAALVARTASMATDAEWLLHTLRDVAPDEEVELDDVIAVQKNLSQRDVTLASRGAGESAALTAADVADALSEVRKNKGP